MKRKFIKHFVQLFITGTFLFYSCSKTPVIPSFNPSTPLYALVIGDTDLTLFNMAVQKAGDSVLFHSIDSITVLLPTNTALSSQGITSAVINAMPAKSLDSFVRYHYIDTATHLTAQVYSSFNSLLGPQVFGYGGTDSTAIYFNGSNALLQKLPGSNALVYKLTSPLFIPKSSITQLLNADTALTYFAEALNHAGINLSSITQATTILAPNNNAFINAGYATLTDIDNEDPATLNNILQYHMLSVNYFTNNFIGLTNVTVANGGTINVTFTNGDPQFTGNSNSSAASVVQGNRIASSNFILHKIDMMLMP